MGIVQKGILTMGLSSSAPWVKYYGNTPASLDYPQKTMFQMVCDAARRHPDHTAYVFMGKKTSYREFMGRIEDLSLIHI